MKAADVPENPIFVAIENRRLRNLGANFTEVMAMVPDFPEKVVRAKLKSLIRRKVIDGCDCGCRGDYLPGLNWPGASK